MATKNTKQQTVPKTDKTQVVNTNPPNPKPVSRQSHLHMRHTRKS